MSGGVSNGAADIEPDLDVDISVEVSVDEGYGNRDFGHQLDADDDDEDEYQESDVCDGEFNVGGSNAVESSLVDDNIRDVLSCADGKLVAGLGADGSNDALLMDRGTEEEMEDEMTKCVTKKVERTTGSDNAAMMMKKIITVLRLIMEVQH